MRLRPSPVVESAGTIAIAYLLVLAWCWATLANGEDLLTKATTPTVLYLFPIFTAQTLVGFAVRNQNKLPRFWALAATNMLLSAGFAGFFWATATQAQSTSGATRSEDLVTSAIVVGLSNLVALAITERFLVGDGTPRLSNTQYVSNPSVSSKSKTRRKK
jgi:hypothetical protein